VLNLITYLIYNIKVALTKGLITFILTLNIAGAFNIIIYNKLIFRLKK
jgi:hypothetical protein